MVAIHTPICDFGWNPPAFELGGIDGKTYTLDDVRGPNGTLVMFICNHCPYVIAVVDRLTADVKALQQQGIGAIAIMSNATEIVSADSFANMKIFAAERGFIDEVIQPRTTRKRIARAFASLRNKKASLPWKKHDNIPL